MAFKAKHAITICSVLFLIMVTVFASYGTYMIGHYSLPIPSTLGALNMILPAVTGISIEVTEANRRKRIHEGGSSARTAGAYTIFFFLTVFETVLATLAGTHISPLGDLNCALDSRWLKLFRSKDAYAIRRIQDGLSCCGLHSPKDKAWPFPDKNHDVNSCQSMLGRDKGCFNSWRDQEQSTATILLLVPILVFIWEMAMILIPESHPSWFRQAQATTPGAEAEYGNSYLPIQYPDSHEPFSDGIVPEDVEEAMEQEQQASTPRVREITPLVGRTQSEPNLDHDHAGWGSI